MGQESSGDSEFCGTVRKETTCYFAGIQIRNIPHYDEPHEQKLRAIDVLGIGSTCPTPFDFSGRQTKNCEVKTIGQSNQRVTPHSPTERMGGNVLYGDIVRAFYVNTAAR